MQCEFRGIDFFLESYFFFIIYPRAKRIRRANANCIISKTIAINWILIRKYSGISEGLIRMQAFAKILGLAGLADY